MAPRKRPSASPSPTPKKPRLLPWYPQKDDWQAESKPEAGEKEEKKLEEKKGDEDEEEVEEAEEEAKKPEEAETETGYERQTEQAKGPQVEQAVLEVLLTEQGEGPEEEQPETTNLPNSSPTSEDASSSSYRLLPLYHPGAYFKGWRGERFDQYATGTLPPVHLGDIYESRYRIIFKMGHGSYSTVWLAIDLQEDERHVALKFLQAEKESEAKIYDLLAMTEGQDEHHNLEAGREFVMELLGSFQIKRNSLTYTVLVSEVLIPIRNWNASEYRTRIDFKIHFWHLAQGLAFLHHRGVTHGDLWDGNIALRLPDRPSGFDAVRELPIPDVIPTIPNSETRREFEFYPKYLVPSDIFKRKYVEAELKKATPVSLQNSRLQILDMSNAYVNPTTYIPATKRTVRGPEFTAYELNGGRGPKIGGPPGDIWALACTMFQFVMGDELKLFNLSSSTYTFLWEIERKIGPIPESWDVGDLTPPPAHKAATAPDLTPMQFWKEVLFKYDGPWPRISERGLRGFMRLLKKMLRVDPENRLSIDEVLADTWFDDVREHEELGGRG